MKLFSMYFLMQNVRENTQNVPLRTLSKQIQNISLLVSNIFSNKAA